MSKASRRSSSGGDPFDFGDPLDVLEDFTILQTPGWTALLPSNIPSRLLADLRAVFAAHNIGVSFTTARKRYVDDESPAPVNVLDRVRTDTYLSGKRHVEETQARFREGAEPTPGEVFSDVALSRLTSTYFAAGLLYRTGNWLEAHAVTRAFLEQVAWAYSVTRVSSFAEAERIKPTTSVTALAALIPATGQLYGYLSQRTHVAIDSHRDFLDTTGPTNAVFVRDHRRATLESAVLLRVADAWSVVYELSQARFMTTLENWVDQGGAWSLREDRPYQSEIEVLKARAVRAFETRA